MVAIPEYFKRLTTLNVAATAEVKALYPHVYSEGLPVSVDNLKGLAAPFEVSGQVALTLWPLLAKSLRAYPKLVRAEQLVSDLATIDGIDKWWLSSAPKLAIQSAYKAALSDCATLPKTRALISYLLDISSPVVTLVSPASPLSLANNGTSSLVFSVTDSLGNPLPDYLVSCASSDTSIVTVTASATTNALGRATFTATADATNDGTAVVTASVLGSPSTATITIIVS